MPKDRKWILTIELIAKPDVKKKDLQDKEMLQHGFNQSFGEQVQVVQVGVMMQQPVKEE